MKCKLLLLIATCFFVISCQKTTLDSKISVKNYQQDLDELTSQFLITQKEEEIIWFNMVELYKLEREGVEIPDSFYDVTYRDILILDKKYNNE